MKISHQLLLSSFSTVCLYAFTGLTPAEAAPVTSDGFSYVKSLRGVDEYRLESNGLQVLLMPEHSAPLVEFVVTYRVGSRNEVTGTTGSTHLLEHLMFKGTEKFNRAKGTGIDGMLEGVGAQYNAMTGNDRTSYFEDVDNEQLPLMIELEADRMRNLLLRDDDRRPEMTVVRNEFEQGENSPTSALYQEVYAAAFQAQPYHHNTIGWRSDIENVPIEKLREFYDTFYWPNNATVMILGDFDPAVALALVRRFYGTIPRSPRPIPQIYTEEPPQTGPRRVTVKRPGQLGALVIAHKIPAGLHPDYAALNVLTAILTRGTNSRLYRALVDKNLVNSVSSGASFSHDPSLHLITAVLTSNGTLEQVEQVIVQEIDRIKKDGITSDELQVAINRIVAEATFARDGGYSGLIDKGVAAGDWTAFLTMDEKSQAVTAADIQRVARKYLDSDQSTTGHFIPIRSAGGKSVPTGKNAAQVAPDPKSK